MARSWNPSPSHPCNRSRLMTSPRLPITALLGGWAIPVLAQQPPVAMVTNYFEWSIAASSTAEAQGWIYKYYLDSGNGGAGVPFAQVTCQNPPPSIVCSARVPLMSNGVHRIEITASNEGGESPRSVPF